jgi:hypothetical protein
VGNVGNKGYRKTVGATGEVVAGATQENAVSGFLLAREIGVAARKIWLRVPLLMVP